MCETFWKDNLLDPATKEVRVRVRVRVRVNVTDRANVNVTDRANVTDRVRVRIRARAREAHRVDFGRGSRGGQSAHVPPNTQHCQRPKIDLSSPICLTKAYTVVVLVCVCVCVCASQSQSHRVLTTPNSRTGVGM